MTNPLMLKEADIQDLSGLVVDFVCRYGSCHKEMNLLAKRFEIDLQLTYTEQSSSISSRSYALLQNINGKTKLLEILDYILKTGFGYKEFDFENYNKILKKYGFVIEPEGATFKLTHMSSGVVEEERQAATSWIEQNANPTVLSCLKDARDNLGKGRFDYVLDDCRKAMEALTNGSLGFSDSLTELVNEGIILQGSAAKKMDAEHIRAIYGYCSTLGSHKSAESPEPDMEQALFGLQNAESCIYFLLKRLAAAKETGKTLVCWV